MRPTHGSGVIVSSLALAFVAALSTARAQDPGEVTVDQANDTLRIHYTINAGRPGDLCKVELWVSIDGGNTFTIKPQFARGLDRLVRVGVPHEIVWAPLAENIELNSDRVVCKVLGYVQRISDEVEFVRIQGGEFLMGDFGASGDADELPVHSVVLTNFEMGMYEVTNLQFCKFLNAYESTRVKSGEFSGEPILVESSRGIHRDGATWTVNPGMEDCPASNITWYGANEFCREKGFRLPTEAEWEYAARVQGRQLRYGNGKDMADPEDINYDASSDTLRQFSVETRRRGECTRVGIFPPNGLGLYDMSGNVWEWCQDWYNADYYTVSLYDPKSNPAGPWFGHAKVIRGGGYGNDSRGIRTTDRSFFHPGRTNPDIGFRVVRR